MTSPVLRVPACVTELLPPVRDTGPIATDLSTPQSNPQTRARTTPRLARVPHVLRGLNWQPRGRHHQLPPVRRGASPREGTAQSLKFTSGSGSLSDKLATQEFQSTVGAFYFYLGAN